MTSIGDIGKKKRGRPATDATPVLVRLLPTQISPLDAWIADQPEPRPSRPEAIRHALTDWLAGQGYGRRGEDPEGGGSASEAEPWIG